MEDLFGKLVVLKNRDTKEVIIRRSIQSSRYHPDGQRRLKKKIYNRLSTYPAEGGTLLTLTIADLNNQSGCYEGMDRLIAWKDFGYRVREFMDRVNKSRKARGLKKVKRYIKVLEDQKDRLYPCPHIWFPGLKWLEDIDVLQRLWPYGNVDLKYADSTAPAAYIIKYIAKMNGRDFMQVMIWHFRLRLYTTSRDFVYIYKDEKDSGWRYHFSGGPFSAQESASLLVAQGYTSTQAGQPIPRGS
jgi:hypothetical protein